jgi:hypothetical protein
VIGIYQITAGTHFYFGQSNDLGRRKASHLSQLRAGKHYNTHLQRAFTKHGGTFKVVRECEEEDLCKFEQERLDAFHGTEGCCNVAVSADHPSRGGTISESHKEILRKHRTGRRMAQESRDLVSEARSTPVRITYTDGTVREFRNQSDARETVGTSRSNFSRWITGATPVPSKYNILAIEKL